MERRRQAFRPNTLKNYISAQRLFLQFCLVHNVNIAYPSEADLAAYTEWLVLAALTTATIKNQLSALKMFYKWWAKPDIVSSLSTPSWALTVKGITNFIYLFIYLFTVIYIAHFP